MKTSRWVWGFVCPALLACGDDGVGSGGTGGSGSVSSASGTSIQSVSATSSKSATSSSSGMGGEGGEGGAGGEGGGETVCEQACDKMENECLIGDVCGDPMQGHPFSCEPPQSHSDCLFQCSLDNTCGEIATFFSSLTGASMRGCVGACDGAALCKQCIADANFGGNCAPELGQCGNDPVCTAWAQCAANCSDQACFDTCDTMHPGGAPLQALYGCICEPTRCGEWCGDAIACPGP